MDPLLEKFYRDFFSPELERREKRTSLGSGVIIDGSRGFVLTNTHVIEKATTISVALNNKRELIGITTAIYAQAQGIGFAIPINRAKRIVSDLINYGEVVQAWVGISVQLLDSNLADYLDIPKAAGVMVADVEPQSPAAKAGGQSGRIQGGHRQIPQSTVRGAFDTT